MTSIAEAANKIAAEWGPALTKMQKDGDLEPIKGLCAPTVELVLGTSDNGEAVFSISDEEGMGTFTWMELKGLVGKDLSQEDYKCSETASLGILGNRMILEVGRYNNKDELYLNTIALLTLTADGKIVKFESFADSLAPGLLDAALMKE